MVLACVEQVVNTFRRYGRTFLIMMCFGGLFVAAMWYFEVSSLETLAGLVWGFSGDFARADPYLMPKS